MVTITILVSIISALLGASLNGLFNRLIARRQYRLQNTLRVYDEYNAKDMLEARHRASSILKANLSQHVPLTIKELKDSLAVEEFYNISRVVRFMEKLATLAEHKQIDRKLTARILGNDLDNWYEVYLARYYEMEKSLINNWFPLSRAIEGLRRQKLITKRTAISLPIDTDKLLAQESAQSSQALIKE